MKASLSAWIAISIFRQASESDPSSESCPDRSTIPPLCHRPPSELSVVARNQYPIAGPLNVEIADTHATSGELRDATHQRTKNVMIEVLVDGEPARRTYPCITSDTQIR